MGLGIVEREAEREAWYTFWIISGPFPLYCIGYVLSLVLYWKCPFPWTVLEMDLEVYSVVMCSWNSCGISMHCITYDFFFFSAGGLCVCEQAVCQELLGHSTVRHQLPSPHFIRHHKSRSEPTFCIEWRKRSAGFLKLCPLALIVLHRGFGEICNVNMFCVSQREKSQEIGQGETLK